MDARSFFELVAAMRAAQRTYFRTKDNTQLRYSKDLERKVDAEIERVRIITKEQQSPKLNFND